MERVVRCLSRVSSSTRRRTHKEARGSEQDTGRTADKGDGVVGAARVRSRPRDELLVESG